MHISGGRMEGRPAGVAYVHFVPDASWHSHFSSILLAGDPVATVLELLLLAGLAAAARLPGTQV